MQLPRRATFCGAGILSVFILPSVVLAQYNERPDLIGSGSAAVDCSGRSIKNMRVRAIHDPTMTPGGTGYFVARDPFLAYQLGRNLNFREFRTRDGIFDLSIAHLGGPMPDGTTAKITANNQVSCSGCHNLPQGNPGGGVTFHKDSGRGRNSPHYYGAGIVEMLAIQVRADILSQIQGQVNVQGQIQTSFAGVNIDQAYGQLLPLRIDSDADGWPDVWDNAPGSPGYKDGVN